MAERIPRQVDHLTALVGLSDSDCLNNLRMTCDVFNRLCYLLRHGVGLKDSKYVSVSEKPEPVEENSVDPRWKWFKGCLGALDGTHIPVLVHLVDQPRYRNRKVEVQQQIVGCSVMLSVGQMD
ncbi:dual specificity protein phosphatase [Striga asiatica]|uniref:Dual specificity protein phosphatase n=1 Tax=Striga asiatica TaxID=4170 RepID=A0A5A7R4F9_STRAF|nr:dual specificity protein phosphatase [Striga asiatica]